MIICSGLQSFIGSGFDEVRTRIFRRNAADRAWRRRTKGVWCGSMGHCKGKDNVKKRAARRKKNERLVLAKSKATAAK
jgi:hypothetical protein